MRSSLGSRAWLVPTLLVVGSLTACDEGSTDAGNHSPSPQVATVSPSPSAGATGEAPIDDPATEEIEVSGTMRTHQVGEGPVIGDAGRGFWEDAWSMSDPRVTGDGETIVNLLGLPDGSMRWWDTSTLRSNGGTWEGIGIGEILADGNHLADGVYLGTGDHAGLEFHQHMAMGPGDIETLPFEVTGWIHPVAVDGWAFDPGFPADGLAEAVRAATAAWNAHDGRAAAPLYAEDAVYVNGSETHVGRSAIASMITEATEAVDFELELLRTPLVIRGNYVAAALRWANSDADGLVVTVFRFDEDGLIAHQEVLAPEW